MDICKEKGYTLVELVTALGVMVVVLTLLFTLLISNIKVFNSSSKDIELQYQAQMAMDTIINKAISCIDLYYEDNKRLVFVNNKGSYEIFEIKENNKLFYINSIKPNTSATLEIANFLKSFDVKKRTNGLELTIYFDNNKKITSEFYFRNRQ